MHRYAIPVHITTPLSLSTARTSGGAGRAKRGAKPPRLSGTSLHFALHRRDGLPDHLFRRGHAVVDAEEAALAERPHPGLDGEVAEAARRKAGDDGLAQALVHGHD